MKYKVTLNGRTYEVEVEKGQAMLTDEYEAYAPAPAAAPAAPPGPPGSPPRPFPRPRRSPRPPPRRRLPAARAN